MSSSATKSRTQPASTSAELFNVPELPAGGQPIDSVGSAPVIGNNPLYRLAYSGVRSDQNSSDIETRLQRLERGQKFVRRGRVVPSTPQFNSQSAISTTTANNPFVATQVNGVNFPPGRVPNSIAPITNSKIKYPRNVDEV